MIQDINSLRDLSLAEKLSRVARLWKMVADRELEPLNLTYPRWTALWKLYRMGDNVSQKHLAEALEIEWRYTRRWRGSAAQGQNAAGRVQPARG